jgi:hypothetical protein
MTLLRVDGAVQRPMVLNLVELAELPEQVAEVRVLIPSRSGQGVRLRAILEHVGSRTDAEFVTLSTASGDFRACVPRSAVEDGIVLYQNAGAPLTEKDGGPLRFLIPNVEECASGGVDACANVKFLAHVELSTHRQEDTRPRDREQHRDLHAREGSPEEPL